MTLAQASNFIKKGSPKGYFMAIYKSEKFGPVDVAVDACEKFTSEKYDGFRVFWSADKIGFGTCDIVFQDDDGKTMYIETEHMADNEHKDFLRALFSDLVDQLNVVE